MSFNELVILMIIALILFGPEDLPDVARAIGRIVFEVKKIAGEMTKEFQDAVNTPTNVLQKALDETVNRPSVAKEKEEKTKGAGANPENIAEGKLTESEAPQEELLTYEEEESNKEEPQASSEAEDPLAELPQDMVSYEK